MANRSRVSSLEALLQRHIPGSPLDIGRRLIVAVSPDPATNGGAKSKRFFTPSVIVVLLSHARQPLMRGSIAGTISTTGTLAAVDGNPETDRDPSWTALLTAPYPEHPSGHLSLDSAHLKGLQMFFGTDKIRFGVTSSRFPGETRYFDRFSDALKEIIHARIWAGLHFRTADIQAKILGRKVADYMAKHYFQLLD